jgi:tRNA(Ile)-lysidine synthase
MKKMVNTQMKLKNYFNLNGISQNKKYLIGFSGGPDSTFLFFHTLNLVGKENIVAAHVNYHLRDEADEAQKLVEQYCKENDVTLFVQEVVNDTNENVEGWARKVRYEFFNHIAAKEKCDAVVIAHTFDDDIETYALQKERSNIVTYFGLKESTYWKDLNVIRPMLTLKKQEVLNWIEDNNLTVDFDKTNEDDKYRRNFIRKHLDHETVELYIREKNSRNRMMQWVYEKLNKIIQPEFTLETFLPLNDKEELVFIYEYIKRFVPNYNLDKMKKNIAGEIAKQLRSDKAYICIKINEKYALIKDRGNVFLKPTAVLNRTFQITKAADLKELSLFANYDEIQTIFEQHGAITVSNDFQQYQAKLTYRGKKASEFYLKNKISYRFRIENAVAFIEGDCEILTKIR